MVVTDGYSLFYTRIPWVNPTSVESRYIGVVPEAFELSRNYPNPFNPTTNIEFKVPATANVQLKIYNTLGEEVATLLDKKMNAGHYKMQFDASHLASGVYFYKLTAGNFTATYKMMLMK